MSVDIERNSARYMGIGPVSEGTAGETGRLMSLETIAATIAHEIKNPLALIKANIDFIELCDTEKKFGVNYDVMKKEIRRANELLVDFGKLLKNGFEMKDVIDLRETALKTAGDYGRYERIEIALEFEPNETDFYIRGNRELFEMALSNVMKNAVEAVEHTRGKEGMDGCGHIGLSVTRQDGELIIAIKDDGGGIARETLDKLEADIPVTSKQYGNGLGVSLTKRIIEGHGGAFEIENNHDGGVSVRIRLREFTNNLNHY